MPDRNPKPAFQVEVSDGESWRPVGGHYPTRKLAQGWLPFVRGYWRGKECRVVKVQSEKHA